jgi:gamma-glutamylcyclotransferase (GGCT)/AIG2-like uncharacterized protein YtfP
MSQTILFVYGTLKRGHMNNHFLASQTFLGEAETLPRYRLYGLGWHPGMVEDANGLAVKGELWSVDADSLAKMDEYEGHPNQFIRKLVEIRDCPGSVESYFFNGIVPPDAPSGSDWPLV